jgi:hypothetical protein
MSQSTQKAAGTKVVNAKKIGNKVAILSGRSNAINGLRHDPTKGDGITKMVPIYNSKGDVASYRYMMQDSTKDQYLGREIPIHKVMGNIESSLFDKMGTPALNQQAVDMLKIQYDSKAADNRGSFIRVDAHSKDPVIRDRWNTLPKETKRYVRSVWGSDGMWVEKDVFNMAMGYRKYDIREFLESDPATLTGIQKVLAAFLGQVPLPQEDGTVKYLPSAKALKFIQAGTIVEELVAMVKDIWVIKNLVTLMGNEFSNITMLMLHGVPMTEIVKGKINAHNATSKYIKERTERDSLQRQVNRGIAVGAALPAAEQRIKELTDSIERSSVHVLMESGQYQTLIEDIEQETDPYSYAAGTVGKLDNMINSRIPGSLQKTYNGIKTVGKHVLMTHDTPIYKQLNKLTMMSDFTARNVLYQYLTQRTRDPLSHEKAIKEARAGFVNYDIPTHRGVQWLNDKGVLFFTKYYLRIQFTIIRLIKENPLRAATMIAANSVLNFPAIFESSVIMGKVPLNIYAGPAELPGAIPDLLTVATGKYVF